MVGGWSCCLYLPGPSWGLGLAEVGSAKRAPRPYPLCSDPMSCAQGWPGPPGPRAPSLPLPSLFTLRISLDLQSPLLSLSALTQSLPFLLPPAPGPPALSVYVYTPVSLSFCCSLRFSLSLSFPSPHTDPGSSLSMSVSISLSLSLCLHVSLSFFLSVCLSQCSLWSLIVLSPYCPEPLLFLGCSLGRTCWGHFLVAHGPSSCYQLEMNQIRKRGSGGVITGCTRGAQLISGGPGFERKCSCDTEPSLPSLSCPWPGGGGYGRRVERERAEGQAPAAPRHMHTHMGTLTLAHTYARARTHTRAYTEPPGLLHTFLALYLPFRCFRTPTTMPRPPLLLTRWLFRPRPRGLQPFLLSEEVVTPVQQPYDWPLS